MQIAILILGLYVLLVVQRSDRILDRGWPLFRAWADAIDRDDRARCEELRARIIEIEEEHNAYVRRRGLGWLAIRQTDDARA